jgi:hypothetical protein
LKAVNLCFELLCMAACTHAVWYDRWDKAAVMIGFAILFNMMGDQKGSPFAPIQWRPITVPGWITERFDDCDPLDHLDFRLCKPNSKATTPKT